MAAWAPSAAVASTWWQSVPGRVTWKVTANLYPLPGARSFRFPDSKGLLALFAKPSPKVSRMTSPVAGTEPRLVKTISKVASEPTVAWAARGATLRSKTEIPVGGAGRGLVVAAPGGGIMVGPGVAGTGMLAGLGLGVGAGPGNAAMTFVLAQWLERSPPAPVTSTQWAMTPACVVRKVASMICCWRGTKSPSRHCKRRPSTTGPDWPVGKSGRRERLRWPQYPGQADRPGC